MAANFTTKFNAVDDSFLAEALRFQDWIGGAHDYEAVESGSEALAEGIASDAADTGPQADPTDVEDANEAPVITGGSNIIFIDEGETFVTAGFTATDPDGDALTFSLGQRYDEDAEFFTIDPATGALRFTVAPDYEHPTSYSGENYYYKVEIVVSDGYLSDRFTVRIGVDNVNEGLFVTSFGGAASATVAATENSQIVATFTVYDPDNTPPHFSLAGADAALFGINPFTGQVYFRTVPDYEAPTDANGDNVYEVTARAGDGAFLATQAWAVTVADTSQGNVTITSGHGGLSTSYSMSENSTAAATIAALDDEGGAVSYRIAGGADAALFAIDTGSGALRFVAAPDYEAPSSSNGTNYYEVTVEATNGSSVDSQDVAIQVTDVAPALAITSLGGDATAATDVAELGWGSVARITTAGASGNVRYSIVPTDDYQAFTVDGAGWLSFSTVPDFEDPHDADRDNVYFVTVRADDNEGGDTQTIAVTVTDLGSPIAITSNGGGATASINFAENGSGAVTIVKVADAWSAPAFSIVGGVDSGAFQLDGNGMLRFASVPDFENARDVDGDNVYEVIVAVKDVEGADTQAISVHVVDFSPIAITSNGGGDTTSINFAENGTGVVTTVRVSGAISQPGYAIMGGADAGLFVIDGAGALRFAAAPDFENARDADGDNIYDVVVRAKDMEGDDVQAISVNVRDLSDGQGVTIIGTSASATHAGTAYADEIRGLGGNDVLYGLGGNDLLDGGAQNDVLIGGAGKDMLIGGSGSDQFVFETLADSSFAAPDTIADFRRGEDRILLSAIDANALASGNQAFTLIGSSAFTGSAGQLRYTYSGGDLIVTGDVDGDRFADFGLIVDGGWSSLSSSDFLL